MLVDVNLQDLNIQIDLHLHVDGRPHRHAQRAPSVGAAACHAPVDIYVSIIVKLHVEHDQ